MLCMACLLGACGHGKGNGQGDVQRVRVDSVVSLGGQQSLQFPGKVVSGTDADLSFKVAGKIQKIYVKEGAKVAKGQLLARLDPTDYQIQLNAAEAQYKQVKAEAERIMALYKEDGVSANDNDKAVYGLRQVTAKYEHAKDELAYTYLYAPFAGTVSKRLFEEHEMISAGMPVIAMMGAGAPEVEISLPAAEYARRADFDGFSCTFETVPGKEFALAQVSINPKANANQLYAMRLQLAEKGGDQQPAPGMAAMVTIWFKDKGGTAEMSIPTGAMFEKEGKSYVFVVDAQTNTARQAEVNPVRLLGNGRCIVRSDALRVGDKVVAAGVHHIANGDKVTAMPQVSKTNVGGLM